MQDWWSGVRRRHRRRDHRVRHGHRQGRHPLRLPLQPAQEPGELRQEIGRAGRDGEPSIVRAAGLPRRRARAGELRLRRHAEPRGGRGAARRAALGRGGRRARRRRVRALHPRRRAPAGAQDAAHLPRARGAAAPGHAVLRGLPHAPARRGGLRRALRALRPRARRVPAARRRGRQAGPDLDDAGARRGRGRRSARSARASSRRSATSRIRASSSCSPRSRASATRCSRLPGDRSALAGEHAGALRAPRARRDRAHPERARARDGRQVPGAGARRVLRRGARAAVRPLQPLPAPAAAALPPASALPAPETVVAPARIAGLRAEHPEALGQPRQLARFLCGLSSPATTRERLSRHELYGALARTASPTCSRSACRPSAA